MSFEFTDRIQSSIIIIGLFLFCFFVHKYLFYGLIFFCCFWSWIEWLSIFKKIKNNNTFIIYFSKIISFIYLIYAGLFVVSLYDADKYIFLIFLMVCIFSDIGGYITGKTIGGKKLTKISPNKTISGSLGSFVFSFLIFYITIYFYDLYIKNLNQASILIPFILSLFTQSGDLFISFFKRKAKIKHTSKLIPGHGGLLDRIDGIIFALPIGSLLIIYLI